MENPSTPRRRDEWQIVQLPREALLELKMALDSDEDPSGTMASLRVNHFHVPYYRVKTPLGGQDIRFTSEAVTEENIPSILDYCQRVTDHNSPAHREVLRLSKMETAPLLGSLKRVTLGDMQILEVGTCCNTWMPHHRSLVENLICLPYLQSYCLVQSVFANAGRNAQLTELHLSVPVCNSQAYFEDHGVSSQSRRGSAATGGATVERSGGGAAPAEPPFANLQLSVHDRVFCEAGPKFGLENLDVDLDADQAYTGQLCSVIDYARKHEAVSLPRLLKAAHQFPAYEPARVFGKADAEDGKDVKSRSLCQLLLSSTLQQDMREKRLVTAGWLQSAEWKTCRVRSSALNVAHTFA